MTADGPPTGHAMRVAIVVLGDLGRSPRMLYHARALTADGALVDLIGESGAPLPSDLQANQRVRCHLLDPARAAHDRRGLSFLLTSAFRMTKQALTLLFLLLFRLPRPDVLLVQTPPAIPTLLIALIAARGRAAAIVVDWHNLGYSMVAHRLGDAHWITRAVRAYEAWLGPLADAHLCVSRAMAAQLDSAWGIEATVLYDEPAAHFVPVPKGERASVLSRALPPQQFGVDWQAADRPPLLITSTSWTDDEDFDLLLDAATEAERRLRTGRAASKPMPNLFLLITGAGRRREACEARIEELALTRVHLHTAWLSAQDYARVLGAADLGISLHRSTSGVDLPMKVADMLGAGLPVCVLDYGPCLRERIEPGRNGLLFSTAAELVDQWFELFQGFPAVSSLLERLQRGVAEAQRPSWTENWTTRAGPVFRALTSRE